MGPLELKIREQKKLTSNLTFRRLGQSRLVDYMHNRP